MTAAGAIHSGGFADAPREAAQAFRAAMAAMARPGAIGRIGGARPPAPLSVAAGSLLLTLCDATTPVHLAGALDCETLRGWLRFQTGAPLVPAQAAMFAVGAWADLAPIDRFPAGTPDYPDRSATLVVEVPKLVPEGARLTGPGIRGELRLSLPDPAALGRNAARYPLGCDLFLTCGDLLAALPRSTRIAEG